MVFYVIRSVHWFVLSLYNPYHPPHARRGMYTRFSPAGDALCSSSAGHTLYVDRIGLCLHVTSCPTGFDNTSADRCISGSTLPVMAKDREVLPPLSCTEKRQCEIYIPQIPEVVHQRQKLHRIERWTMRGPDTSRPDIRSMYKSLFWEATGRQAGT